MWLFARLGYTYNNTHIFAVQFLDTIYFYFDGLMAIQTLLSQLN